MCGAVPQAGSSFDGGPPTVLEQCDLQRAASADADKTFDPVGFASTLSSSWFIAYARLILQVDVEANLEGLHRARLEVLKGFQRGPLHCAVDTTHEGIQPRDASIQFKLGLQAKCSIGRGCHGNQQPSRTLTMVWPDDAPTFLSKSSTRCRSPPTHASTASVCGS